MENTISEEEYFDGLSENPSKNRKSLIKEDDFIKCLQFYPCLLEKSQTPDMKMKKQAALEAMEEKIKKVHGINLNTSQIRKKIENMKARVKSKGGKKRTGNRPTMLKDHEKKLLHLMDCTNNPVINEIPGAEQCVMPGTSTDPDEDEHPVFIKEEELPEPSNSNSQFWQVTSPKRSNQSNQCSMIDLKKEVLLEQKELNKQQTYLNIQQKEIFALKKQKLLLEIELLKKKLN